VYNDDVGSKTKAAVSYGDEVGLLEDLMSILTSSNRIATYNGLSFDIPYIYKRAIIRGVKPKIPMSLWTKRYAYAPHCDIMQAWAGWDIKGYVKLDVLAGMFDLEITKLDYKAMPEMLLTDNGVKEILYHNAKDAEATWHLYQMFHGVLF
jgi:DNA polymerase elongation subunit (family B)